MEYETKKAEILAGVEYSNLLQFSLVENKLERNFRSIVEALMLNQSKTEALNDEHIAVRDKHSQQIAQLKNQITELSVSLQNSPRVEQKQQVEVTIEKKASNHQIEVDVDRWAQWEGDKNNFLIEINQLREKVGMIGFFEGEIETLKKDLSSLKSDIAHLRSAGSSKSSLKSLKRQSILSMKKQSEKSVNVNFEESPNKQNDLQIVDITGPILNESSSSNSNDKINVVVEETQNELNSVYMELNTLKLSLEELKDMISESKKAAYKHGNSIADLKQGLAKEIKDRINEDQNLERLIKQLQVDVMNCSAQEAPVQQTTPGSPGKREEKEEVNANFKNQLNDKISKLQAMILNFVTENEFNRFKKQTRDSLQKLDNSDRETNQHFQAEIKRLQGLLGDKNLEIERLTSDLQGLGEQVANNLSQSERKNNICLSKIEQLKKSLQNLRQDMEFYQSMAEDKKATAPQQVTVTVENKEEGGKSSSLGEKEFEDLKRYFVGKMQDLRANLIGMIRDVEKKLNNRSSVDHEIVKLWDKLNEANLFLNKKADQDDTKKSLMYLEKKINRLNGYLMKSDENNIEDARIARSNQWNCLSCDKNLQNYQGKVGRHVVWESMPLKGISKNLAKEESKKSLPQLKR